MKKIVHIIFIATMLFVASCTHKELCDSHPHTIIADVAFDWSKAPEASPESMSVYLFPDGGGKALRYEFGSPEGGKIKITRGKYKAICLNSDTRNIQYENKDSFEDFIIKSKQSTLHTDLSHLGGSAGPPPRARGVEDEMVVSSPDSLWVGSVAELAFDDDNKSLHIELEPAFITFNIEIKNIDNLEHTYALTGALSTLSDGFIPSSKTLSEDVATIPFMVDFSVKEKLARGKFLAFGHCPSQNMKHYLTIYATMNDGSNTCFTYDVTGYIHNEGSTNNNNIVIVLDTLPLPEPEYTGGGGGLTPSITGWNTVEINIGM